MRLEFPGTTAFSLACASGLHGDPRFIQARSASKGMRALDTNGADSRAGQFETGIEHLPDPRLQLSKVGPGIIVELHIILRQDRTDPAFQ